MGVFDHLGRLDHRQWAFRPRILQRAPKHDLSTLRAVTSAVLLGWWLEEREVSSVSEEWDELLVRVIHGRGE